MVDTVSVGGDDDYYYYCCLEEMELKGKGGMIFNKGTILFTC